MFKTISAFAGAALALSVLTAPAASADSFQIDLPSGGESSDPAPVGAVPEGEVTIDLVNVNGSGCEQGTTAVSVAPDKTAFTVTYSDYLAHAGGSSTPLDSRKNCQIVAEVNVPQGFTYAITKADYRGYAALLEGATGTQKASYYFQGMTDTVSAEHKITGPYFDNWQFSDEAGIYAYAPCDATRNLNINTELRVNEGTVNSDETSFMVMDSTDGSIASTYHFSWKECD